MRSRTCFNLREKFKIEPKTTKTMTWVERLVNSNPVATAPVLTEWKTEVNSRHTGDCYAALIIRVGS